MARVSAGGGLCLALFLAFANQATGREKDCDGHFANGMAPALVNPKLAEKTRGLCFWGFSVLHSGVTRGPLWSAEKLTADMARAARELTRPRGNRFHEEASLPPDERSRLDDYRRSGFDRGHMTPSGDMPDTAAQEETFTLANVIPQNACSNEVLWEGIESAVRDLARLRGEIFIVTGPAFKGEELESLKGRVLVPTHLFKAVYVPSRNLAAAYSSPNDASGTWEAISITELQKRTGIDPFPSIAQEVKDKVVGVPEPVSHYHCRRERGQSTRSSEAQRRYDYQRAPHFEFSQ